MPFDFGTSTAAATAAGVLAAFLNTTAPPTTAADVSWGPMDNSMLSTLFLAFNLQPTTGDSVPITWVIGSQSWELQNTILTGVARDLPGQPEQAGAFFAKVGTVPEPSSLASIALGLALLVYFGNRRRLRAPCSAASA